MTNEKHSIASLSLLAGASFSKTEQAVRRLASANKQTVLDTATSLFHLIEEGCEENEIVQAFRRFTQTHS